MNVEYISKIGRYHHERGTGNDDSVFTVRDGNIAVVAMCDGAGGLSGGGQAASLLSCVLAPFVLERFDRLFLSTPFYAKRELIYLIESTLEQYSLDSGIPVEQLATTVLIAAADADSGRVICFHLGDGIILRQKGDDGRIDVVSSPRNGLTKNTTYLTGCCDLWKHMNFYRWSDRTMNKLILMTDGACEHLVRMGIHKSRTLIPECAPTIEAMDRYLAQCRPIDDYSCGILTIFE